MIPFFEEFPPAFDRSLNRFRLFRLAVHNIKKLHKSKFHAMCFDFGEDARSKPVDVILNLIDLRKDECIVYTYINLLV